MGRRFSDEDYKEWVRLYLVEEWSYYKISQKYSCASLTVRYRLVAEGVSLRPNVFGRGKKKRFDDVTIQEWKRLYEEEDVSLTCIAKKYGCTPMTVRYHLMRLGVDTRKKDLKKEKK